MKNFIESNANDILWAQEVAAFVRNQGDETGAKEIELAIQEYSSRKISIVLVGLNKRGKSTFCNALLGRKDDLLAPVDWQPATGVLSSFCSSDLQEEALVHFDDGKSREISYEEIRDYVLEQRNPENNKKVERVDVFGHFDLDKDAVLIDLPGDDSIHAYHSQIVYNYLPNADIILFMSSAEDPITQAELNLLSKIKTSEMRKIFFVINKADSCDANELEEAKAHNLDVLKKAQIPYANQLYCISAKEIMETGNDSFEFGMLVNDVKHFLNENKLGLQKEGFHNLVRNLAAGLVEKLELQAQAAACTQEELEQKISGFKESYAKSKDLLAHGIGEFSENWEAMITAFETQLPELEQKTKADVKEYISAIPAMSMGKKTVAELPEKVGEIVSRNLSAPLAEVEEQIKNSLNKLEVAMKDINLYLSDNGYEVKSVSSVNYHLGSVVAGGTFIGIGGALMSVVTGATATMSGVPLIGGLLAGVAGTVTAPLAVLAAPLLLAGSAFLAFPFVGWVRGKNLQKKQLQESAEQSITRTFVQIRTAKLPLLKQQGETLALKLKDTFKNKMELAQQGLEEALEEKKAMLTAGNDTSKVSANRERIIALLDEK